MSPARQALEDTAHRMALFMKGKGVNPLQGQIEARRSGLRLALPVIGVLRRHPAGVFVMLTVLVFFYPQRWFARRARAIYAVSLSKNNTVALGRLSAAMGKDWDGAQDHSDDKNLVSGGFAAPNSRTLPLTTRFALLVPLWGLAGDLHRRDEPNGFVFLYQMLATICLPAFERDLRCANPACVVVANDHSPPTLALLSLCRVMGVRSIYVQHGAVTPEFPRLNVDLACLHNARSEAAYREHSGQTPAQIAYLPPFDRDYQPLRRPAVPFKICIALSFFHDEAMLRALLSRLAAHPRVKEVVISPHPRSRYDLSTFAGPGCRILPRGEPAGAIARQVDLCLVAGSGVALEYLHHGCPVFDIAPADPRLDDYYGFVAAGLVPRLSMAVLDDMAAFDAHFDAGWRDVMRSYDPTLDTPIAALQGRVRALVGALSGTGSN